MPTEGSKDITALLARWKEGDDDAGQEILSLIYPELRIIAQRQFRRERANHTLQPTALANEAYLRMAKDGAMGASDRVHFLALASRVVHRVLVDHSRKRGRAKRGAEVRVPLDEAQDGVEADFLDLAELDQALDRLAEVDALAYRLVELRFFGGLTIKEAADVMNLSVTTLGRLWTFAKAWLYGELAGESTGTVSKPG